MKTLPMTALLVVAAVLGAWFFLVEPGVEPPPAYDAGPEVTPEPADVRSSDAPRPTPQRGGAPAEAVAPAEVGEPEPQPASAPSPGAGPGSGLAAVFVERATWTAEPAQAVLEQLAAAAGKRLVIGASVRSRVRAMRVTMAHGRTALPRALDLVLQPGVLRWRVHADKLVVFDDED